MDARRSRVVPLIVIGLTGLLLLAYLRWQGGEKFGIEAIGEVVGFPVYLASRLPEPSSRRVLTLMLRHNGVIDAFSLVPFALLAGAAALAAWALVRRSLALSLVSSALALGLLGAFHLTKHAFVTYHSGELEPSAVAKP